jgi:hypothetical protein
MMPMLGIQVDVRSSEYMYRSVSLFVSQTGGMIVASIAQFHGVWPQVDCNYLSPSLGCMYQGCSTRVLEVTDAYFRFTILMVSVYTCEG